MKQGNPIDLQKYELQNARIQNLSSAPSSPVEGQIYFDTTLHQLGSYQNSTWIYLSSTVVGGVTRSGNSSGAGVLQVSGGADKTIADYTSAGGIPKVTTAGVVSIATPGTDYVTQSSTNTFTNKTYDAQGTGNTLSNITTSNFAVNVIDTDTTLAANSDTRIASQKATKAYVDGKVTNALVYTGAIDASTNPNYPAATKGAFYKISVAGLIGGASGIAVQVGDALIANTTNAGGTQASVGSSWDIIQANVDQATTSTLGLVQLATSTEANAKSNSTKALTPASIAGFTRGYAQNFGDGTATNFTITHNLGTLNVIVTIRLNSTGEQVVMDNVAATTNTVTLAPSGSAPTSNQYNIIIIGI